MNSNEMTVALRFARLLNQARTYLAERVKNCEDCVNGCIVCQPERDFLELCNREVGPIIRTQPPAAAFNRSDQG